MEEELKKFFEEKAEELDMCKRFHMIDENDVEEICEEYFKLKTRLIAEQ